MRSRNRKPPSLAAKMKLDKFRNKLDKDLAESKKVLYTAQDKKKLFKNL
jgi:hypothetical protein